MSKESRFEKSLNLLHYFTSTFILYYTVRIRADCNTCTMYDCNLLSSI